MQLTETVTERKRLDSKGTSQKKQQQQEMDRKWQLVLLNMDGWTVSHSLTEMCPKV